MIKWWGIEGNEPCAFREDRDGDALMAGLAHGEVASRQRFA